MKGRVFRKNHSESREGRIWKRHNIRKKELNILKGTRKSSPSLEKGGAKGEVLEKKPKGGAIESEARKKGGSARKERGWLLQNGVLRVLGVWEKVMLQGENVEKKGKGIKQEGGNISRPESNLGRRTGKKWARKKQKRSRREGPTKRLIVSSLADPPVSFARGGTGNDSQKKSQTKNRRQLGGKRGRKGWGEKERGRWRGSVGPLFSNGWMESGHDWGGKKGR